jgi:hypothetical protein
MIGIILALSTGAAQASPADTINVIGRKPEEVRREAQAFVRLTGVAERPVARWVDPVCPAVLDVAPAVARRIEAQVREIARTAGARIAPAGCAPNLKIVFAHDAQAVTRDVAARSGASFEDLDSESRALMFGASAPVRWWHTVQDRTKDGMRASSPMGDPPPGARLDGIGTLTLGGAVHQQYRSSFLSSQMVRGIIAAKVIVDVKLAEGVPVDSIAAYAALVGLAEIRMGDEAPPNSILGLFDKAGARELTTLDQTFLRTLYRLPLDRTAIAHRGLLVRGLVRGETRKEDR